jgi:hypothetical protein
MTKPLLLDSNDLGTLQITGADRQTWLNGLVTCDVKSLKPGQGAYGLALSKIGKILADLRIVLTTDRIFLGVPRQAIAQLVESMERYLIMEDCELVDLSTTCSWIELHGEDTAAIASEIAEKFSGISTSIDRSGLGGAVVMVPSERHDEALVALASERALVPASVDDWTAFRVIHKIPERGREFDEKTYPQEASLERRAVSFSKGCYLGQEAVCMLEMRGKTQRKIVGLIATGERELRVGFEIVDGRGERVGEITSATRDGEVWKALAMVKTTALASGALKAGDVDVVVG